MCLAGHKYRFWGLLGMLNTIGRVPYKPIFLHEFRLLGMLNTIGRVQCTVSYNATSKFARYVKYNR